jgi:hypothetical protein
MNKFTLDILQQKLEIKDFSELYSFDRKVIKEIKIGKNYYYKISPTSDLYRLNKKFSEHFLSKYPLNDCSVAYRKKLSYFDFFKPHIINNHFVRLDIKSFFPSIQEEDVNNAILSYFPDDKVDIGLKKKIPLPQLLSSILYCEIPKKGKIIPVGFPTSPFIANIVFRKVDIQIQEFCSKHNVVYTRYSDDLLFSSNNKNLIHSEYFENHISFVIAQLKMKLNSKKTIKTSSSISLNGYQISNINKVNYFSFSHKRLKDINHFIHLKTKRNLSNVDVMKKLYKTDLNRLKLVYKNKSAFIKKFCDSQIFNKAAGYRSFLISLIQYDNKNACIERQHKTKLISLIDEMNKILDSF